MEKIDFEKLRNVIQDSKADEMTGAGDELANSRGVQHVAEGFAYLAATHGATTSMFVGFAVLWFQIGRRYGQQEIIDKSLEGAK